MTKHVLRLSLLLALCITGCRPEVSSEQDASESDGGMCQYLPRLYSVEDLLEDRALCPTIWSFYQDRLLDDYSGNVQGPYCWLGLACSGVQLQCPYNRLGGEAACSQENVRDCVLFLRDATLNGYNLEQVESYLRCNCRC